MSLRSTVPYALSRILQRVTAGVAALHRALPELIPRRGIGPRTAHPRDEEPALQLPVKSPVVNGFENVLGGDAISPGDVGDRPAYT